jgi:4-hydroxy-tetrahydrodipicolinate synthase
MSLEIRGCGTALVTPFRKDGSVDEAALRKLVQFQLREGIDFLVPCGTTGETPTLEHGEYLGVIRLVLEEAGGKVPVVAGVGGNYTKKVCALAS